MNDTINDSMNDTLTVSFDLDGSYRFIWTGEAIELYQEVLKNETIVKRDTVLVQGYQQLMGAFLLDTCFSFTTKDDNVFSIIITQKGEIETKDMLCFLKLRKNTDWFDYPLHIGMKRAQFERKTKLNTEQSNVLCLDLENTQIIYRFRADTRNKRVVFPLSAFNWKMSKLIIHFDPYKYVVENESNDHLLNYSFLAIQLSQSIA